MKDVALVTGGAKRLGHEICLMLAKEGYDIALHFNTSKKEAEHTKEIIETLGRRCLLVQGELSDTASYRQFINKVNKSLGTLTLLVNNASRFEKIAFKNTTKKVFDHHFNIHVRAPFFLSQEFAKTSSKGAIVNLLDARVETYQTEYFSYTLTKKTLKEMTLLLAKELAPNIRVNGICPGPILAPENLGDDFLNKIAQMTPMKRPGSVKDILSAIKYLAQSDYITGEILFVDGGERLV